MHEQHLIESKAVYSRRTVRDRCSGKQTHTLVERKLPTNLCLLCMHTITRKRTKTYPPLSMACISPSGANIFSVCALKAT